MYFSSTGATMRMSSSVEIDGTASDLDLTVSVLEAAMAPRGLAWEHGREQRKRYHGHGEPFHLDSIGHRIRGRKELHGRSSVLIARRSSIAQ